MRLAAKLSNEKLVNKYMLFLTASLIFISIYVSFDFFLVWLTEFNTYYYTNISLLFIKSFIASNVSLLN